MAERRVPVPVPIAMPRRAWNDSVWSKVIAAEITGALAAVGGFTMKHFEDVGSRLMEAFAASVVVPVWLVCCVVAAPSGLGGRRGHPLPQDRVRRTSGAGPPKATIVAKGQFHCSRLCQATGTSYPLVVERRQRFATRSLILYSVRARDAWLATLP